MSFDITKIEKDESILKIEKIKTNNKGFLYFIFIVFILALIVFFANPDTRWIVSIAALSIIISSLLFIFHKYKITFDLKNGKVIIEKRFIFEKKTVFPLTEIVDYKIKDGEGGVLLSITKGINTPFAIKPEKRYTILRTATIEEAEKMLKMIKDFVSRETI